MPPAVLLGISLRNFQMKPLPATVLHMLTKNQVGGDDDLGFRALQQSFSRKRRQSDATFRRFYYQ